MKTHIFACLLSFVIFTSAISFADAGSINLTVETVEASLRQNGSTETLKKYFSCNDDTKNAYSKIALGERSWVQLAERILHYSDACYTEGILSSLGTAMQNHPENVLPLVNTSTLLSAKKICIPFISNEIPIEEQQSALTKSKTAIARVTDDRLKPARDACLEFISAIETRIIEQN